MPAPVKKIRPKKASAAKLRSWRVAILGSRVHYLGEVREAKHANI
jgi:hypothetical protein